MILRINHKKKLKDNKDLFLRLNNKYNNNKKNHNNNNNNNNNNKNHFRKVNNNNNNRKANKNHFKKVNNNNNNKRSHFNIINKNKVFKRDNKEDNFKVKRILTKIEKINNLRNENKI